MAQRKSAEYKRGYKDGLEMKDAEHIKGEPEPIYRPMQYPEYVDGHKAGREKSIRAGK